MGVEGGEFCLACLLTIPGERGQISECVIGGKLLLHLAGRNSTAPLPAAKQKMLYQMYKLPSARRF